MTKKILSLCLAALMMLTLLPVSALAAVTSVTISPNSDLTIEKGGTLELSAEVSVDSGESMDVTWSLDGSYASGTSISETGTLTAAAEETADSITVKATSTADSEKYATVTVTVTEPEATVTAVTVSPSTASVAKGATQSFSATVTGENDPSQDVTWSIVETVVDGTSISTAGVLTVASGETETSLTVTATSDADDSVSGTATVTVTEAEDTETGGTGAEATVTAVTVSPSTASVAKGATQSFSATVTGENDPSQDVTWSIVETVVDGTSISTAGVLTVASGETATSLTVTATSAADDSKTGTATVTVTEATAATVTAVTVTPSAAYVQKGATQSFTAEVAGENDPSQDVTWSVSGNAVEGTSISSEGVLTVASDETAETLTVTATSTVDTDKSGAATVTVIGSDTEAYTIYTSIGDNGTVTIEGGLESAPAGTEIVLNVTPDDGYEVKSLYYMDFSDYSTYDIVESGGTYSFTMPADRAYIYATFWATLEDGEYHLAESSTTIGGTVTFDVKDSSDNVTENALKAKEGDFVTINFTPTWSTSFIDELTLAPSNSSVELTATQTSRDYDDGSSTWTFTMPACDVTVDVSVTNMKMDYTVKTVLNNGSENGQSVEWSKYVTSSKGSFEDLFSNSSLTIYAKNVIDGKYYTHTISLKSTEDFTSDATPPEVTQGDIEDDATAYTWGAFMVTSGEITVTFTEVTAAYGITNNVSDLGGESTFDVVNGTMAQADDTVTMTLTADTASGYYYDTDTAPQPVVTDGNNESVTVTAVEGADTDGASFTFTMPAGGVTVTAPEELLSRYESVSISVVSSDLVSVSPTSARAGETVTLTVNTTDTDSIRYIKIQGDGAPIYLDADATSFVMPEGDTVTVAAYTATTWLDEGKYDADLYASSADDWTIYNAADLAAFAKKLLDDDTAFAGYTITIADDIDLSDYTWVPVRAGRYSSHAFTLEGGGHTISGMYVTDFGTAKSSYYGAGLFSGTTSSFYDLTIEGTIEAHVRQGQGTTHIGGLAGYTSSSDITNCTVDVDITVDGYVGESNYVYIAGISGNTGDYINTAALGDITVQDLQTRTLVIGGVNTSGNSENINSYCLSDITVADSVSVQYLRIGGLMYYASTEVENSYFGGSITLDASATTSQNIGGVSVTLSGTPGACYSYYSPVLPEGTTCENFKTVDSEAAYVEDTTTTLLDTLNAWVSENQTQDDNGENVYLTWTTGSEGKPVFAAEDTSTGSKYAITKEIEGDGSVAVDSQGTAGSEMTISISADRFSEVESVTVYLTDNSTRTVSVYENDDGTYSFYMPGAAATVKVVFTDISYSITLNQTGQGDTTIWGESSNSAEKAKAGETVNITLAPDADSKYYTSEFTVTDADSNELSLTVGSNSNEWSFTMPESAVTIDLTYKLCDWYEEDGSLEPGTYTLDASFGSYYHIEEETMYGAMGYDAQTTELTFTVNEDGSIHVDSYTTPTIQNPLGYAGFGEIKISKLQTGNTNGDYRIRDNVDLGDVTDENYPLTLTTDNVLSWCIVPMTTGEKSEYTGSVYTTAVTETDSDEVIGYIYTSDEVGSIEAPGFSTVSNQIFPNEIAFDLPSTVDIKNTGDVTNALIHVATFPAQMGYYVQMLILPDFGTIQKVEESDDDTETVNVALWRGSYEPGTREDLPMGEDVIDSTATLTTLEDGGQTLTLTFGETIVGSIHGHLCSVQLFTGDTVTAAYQNCINLQSATNVTVDSWFTSNLNTSEMTVYTGDRYKMTTSNGAVYYTTDGVAANWDGEDTNLVYPGTVTIDLPDYFDASDTDNYNNEIYIWTYIDAMGSDTSSGTLLKIVVGETGGGSSEENPLEDLITAYTSAKKLVESNYTATTWTTFKSALEAAQTLISDCSTNETAIDNALTALNNAVDGLELALTDTTVQDDDNMGVKAQATSGAIPSGGKLVVTDTDSTTKTSVVSRIQSKLSTSSETVVLDNAMVIDFKVMDSSGNETDLGNNGFVKLTIDIPDGMDTSKIKLYHVDDSGNVTEMEGEVVDGKFVVLVSSFSYYVLAEKSETTNSGGDTGGNDEDFLSDGNYLVDVYLWNATSNVSSMGDVAFENNRQALITVENEVVTSVEIATNPVTISTYYTAITAVLVPAATNVSLLETEGLTTSSGNTVDYIKRFGFTMPNAAQPEQSNEITYVDIQFKVPDTPMGSGYMSARLKFVWSTADETTLTTLKANTSAATGTMPDTGDSESDNELTITDETTGVQLSAAEGVIPEDATLNIEEITSGDTYEKAEAAFTDTVDKFILFDITLFNDGAEIQPDGTITLRFPIPDDFDEDKVAFYRIEDDGTATLMSGSVSDGEYVVNLTSLSYYALVENIEAVSYTDEFTDIGGHWAKEAIEYVVEKELFSGTSETTFSPDTSMTRGMFVTVLGRMYGVDTSEYTTTSFTDVDDSQYYAPYVAWAVENEIVSGIGENMFGPDENITREQMAVLLYRYASFKGCDVTSAAEIDTFTDKDSVSGYATEAMGWAVGEGLIEGTDDTTLSPQGTATRAQVATILMRFIENIAE